MVSQLRHQCCHSLCEIKLNLLLAIQMVRGNSPKESEEKLDFYISRALIVAEPWLDLILSGKKIWEMRSRSTKLRGWVGLIRKGSGKVVGAVKITGSGDALDTNAMLANHDRHLIPVDTIRAGLVASWNTPWYLENAIKFAEPIHYHHPSGAVTWVSLEDAVCQAIAAQMPGSISEASQSFVFAAPKPTKTTLPLSKPAMVIPVQPLNEPVLEKVSERYLGEAEVTNGNLKNNHIYLRGFLDAFPSDLIAGRDQVPPKMAYLSANGITATETDICPRHRFFRDRSWTRRFFEMNDAQPGDRVAFYEFEDLHYRLQLIKSSS